MVDKQNSRKVQLPRLRAFCDACLGRPMEHFPHRPSQGQSVALATEEIAQSIAKALEPLSAGAETEADQAALDALVARSRETLDEVKAQTEYQDQKSTRLLTAATFLVALAGALINAFAQHHRVTVVWGGELDPSQLPAALVFGLFAVFVFSVAAGALVTFHATQTRFRYEQETAIKSGPPSSQIFFKGIVRAEPAEWALSFTETAGQGSVPAKDLSLRYAKNYILESYLVAAKAADKMRYLEAAQGILAFALKVLLVWLAVLAVVAALGPGDPKEVKTMKVEVIALPAQTTSPPGQATPANAPPGAAQPGASGER